MSKPLTSMALRLNFDAMHVLPPLQICKGEKSAAAAVRHRAGTALTAVREGLMVATRPVRAAAAASKEPGGMSLYAIEKRKLKGSSVSGSFYVSVSV